jgi:hypothetical protein
MKVTGRTASSAQLVPITPDHSELIMLEFGPDGRLQRFAVVRGTLIGETAEAAGARDLVEQLNRKLSRVEGPGGLAELHRRARLALDLIENLQALEELHGAEARAALSGLSPTRQGAG